MKEKILVTGAYGFLGKSIQNILKGCNDKRLFLSDIKKSKKSNYIQCDFVNYTSVKNLIHTVKPDKIYHLAGTFTNDYIEDYNGNVLSTKNILSSIKQVQPNCRIMLIGSAAEYGIKPKKGPVKENQELNPHTFYGLSKVFQTHLMNVRQPIEVIIFYLVNFTLTLDLRLILLTIVLSLVWDNNKNTFRFEYMNNNCKTGIC